MDDFDTPIGKTKGVSQQPGDFARDGRGTPWVTDPFGAVVKSGARKGEPKLLRYGRPSSLGKDIENTYNLQRWSERQIAIGMTIEDQTLTDWLLKLAELDPDSDEAKDAADAIVVQAKRLAKAGLAAERGTHMHAVTEDGDTDRDWISRAQAGEDLGLPVEVQAAMLAAFDLMLGQYGIEVLAVEQAVVHDGWRQAGTLDRIGRLTRSIAFANGIEIPAGTIVVLDVKTGKLRLTPGGVIEYWHSYGIQIVAYADAVPYNVDTNTRDAWAYDIAKDWAIIAHLPVDEALQGKATCRLVLVDLQASREAVESIVLPAKAWQARTDIFALPAEHEPTIEVPIELALVEHDELDVDPFDGLPTATSNSTRAVRHDFGPTTGRGLDEGGRATDKQVARVREEGAKLTAHAKAVLDELVRAAKAVDRGFSIGTPTVRRWHIYRALIRLGLHFGDDLDDAHVRATLALVLPEAAQLAIPLGPAIGSLTVDEAEAFVRAAIAVLAADPALQLTDTDVRWLDVSLTAA